MSLLSPTCLRFRESLVYTFLEFADQITVVLLLRLISIPRVTSQLVTLLWTTTQLELTFFGRCTSQSLWLYEKRYRCYNVDLTWICIFISCSYLLFLKKLQKFTIPLEYNIKRIICDPRFLWIKKIIRLIYLIINLRESCLLFLNLRFMNLIRVPEQSLLILKTRRNMKKRKQNYLA